MRIDFVNTYIPKLTELTDAQLQEVRNRLENYLRSGWPEEDMRPNTPVGDRVLTPFAHLVAALETGMDRFTSDLDLEAVANGTIWNCGFVEKFLQNFAPYTSETLRSYGTIRLVFNEDKEYTLKRQMRFQFGDNVFDLVAHYPGVITLRPVGARPEPQSNEYTLTDLGDGTYAVNLFVRGAMTSAVAAGDTASVTEEIPELASVTALTDFQAGTPENSLPKLAARTRQTSHAAALTNRGGAVSFLKMNYPDLIGASAILSGEPLMLRDSVNPLGIAKGCVDLFARSTQYDFKETLTVQIPFVETQGSATVQKFIGKLELPGRASVIESLNYGAITLFPGADFEVYSRSTNPAKAPFLTAAGTEYEELWIVFDMPRTSSDLVPTSTNEDGVRYANFQLTYRYDPLLPTIAGSVHHAENKPANVDVLCRPFIPIVITRFNVLYTKQQGQTINLAQAQAEIYSYLRGLSYPQGFSEARIADSMYYCGAEDVLGIQISGKVCWSAATKVLPSDATLPSVDVAAAIAAARPVPTITISEGKGMALSNYTDLAIGTAAETFASIGLHNLCYVLDADAITFSEEVRG